MPDALPEICSCLGLRMASRHLTQFYDLQMAPVGLTISQFSILVRTRRHDGIRINALASDLSMDRTTMSRNLLPLEREGLLAVLPDPAH